MAKNSKPGTPAGSKQPPVRPTGRPPAKKTGKSIVNQKSFPWGWVITAAVLVIFAAVIVVIAVSGSKDKNKNPYTAGELDAVKGIQGVVYKDEPNHTHKEGVLKYDTTPPIGGDHNPYWADCSGTVYASPIADENAVHSLEHGAVWITYNADKIKGADLEKLKSYVTGRDYSLLSPYSNLDSPISLQFWGYQLKVEKADDPRIQQFIDALVHNPDATPEYGASCSNPEFKASPSTPGHPWAPGAAGAPSMSGSTAP